MPQTHLCTLLGGDRQGATTSLGQLQHDPPSTEKGLGSQGSRVDGIQKREGHAGAVITFREDSTVGAALALALQSVGGSHGGEEQEEEEEEEGGTRGQQLHTGPRCLVVLSRHPFPAARRGRRGSNFPLHLSRSASRGAFSFSLRPFLDAAEASGTHIPLLGSTGSAMTEFGSVVIGVECVAFSRPQGGCPQGITPRNHRQIGYLSRLSSPKSAGSDFFICGGLIPSPPGPPLVSKLSRQQEPPFGFGTPRSI